MGSVDENPNLFNFKNYVKEFLAILFNFCKYENNIMFCGLDVKISEIIV